MQLIFICRLAQANRLGMGSLTQLNPWGVISPLVKLLLSDYCGFSCLAAVPWQLIGSWLWSAQSTQCSMLDKYVRYNNVQPKHVYTILQMQSPTILPKWKAQSASASHTSLSSAWSSCQLRLATNMMTNEILPLHNSGKWHAPRQSGSPPWHIIMSGSSYSSYLARYSAIPMHSMHANLKTCKIWWYTTLGE